jgi:hypothetical protein
VDLMTFVCLENMVKPLLIQEWTAFGGHCGWSWRPVRVNSGQYISKVRFGKMPAYEYTRRFQVPVRTFAMLTLGS